MYVFFQLIINILIALGLNIVQYLNLMHADK
jgi:hypothetical protein